MANGTIVKYKKVLKITIEGKSDTSHPDEEPAALKVPVEVIHKLVEVLDSEMSWRSVTIKEVKR